MCNLYLLLQMARSDVMPGAVEASLCDCVAYFLCDVWLSKKCSFFCIVPYMCWCDGVVAAY